MISVLQFSNTLTRGGVEEHMLSLLQGLDRRVFQLYLACTPAVLKQIGSDIPNDVEVLPIELVSFSSAKAALQLARFLRKKRIQIVHSHMFQSSMLASPIAKLCGVRVVIETPHIREHWRRGWLKRRFFVDRLVARTVDHYVAVSGANAEYLAQIKGLPARKIGIIRSASDVSSFDPGRIAPSGLRESLAFGSHDPVLVVVGRLEPQKGHEVLLKAMPAVVREIPQVRLVCLSEGQLRSDLERQVVALGLTNNVRFVGYQPDIRDWLALSDLTVLPSFFEGLPLTVIESLAAGRPVIASAVDGVPEVVSHGENGLLVPAGNSEKLAEAICLLLKDPQLRQAMARKGREKVLQEFGVERLIRETHHLYLRACARSQRNHEQQLDTDKSRIQQAS
jgi:glycosyltransferase involved in cell wall biosynthesis